MKVNTHPTYYPQALVNCACGNSFTTGSTKQQIQIEICSACHPFYTGEMKFIDTAGRVDKFRAKIQTAQASTYIKKKDKQAAKRAARIEALEQAPQTMKEMMTEVRKTEKPKSQKAEKPTNKEAKKQKNKKLEAKNAKTSNQKSSPKESSASSASPAPSD